MRLLRLAKCCQARHPFRVISSTSTPLRLLIVDNYDSFTYNLVQYFGELGAKVDVLRNDAASAEAVSAQGHDAVVLSPGPGRPEDAALTWELAAGDAIDVPILGVCLGHQAIGARAGATVVEARTIMHGKTSELRHAGEALFTGMNSPFTVTRYHSLVLEPASMPAGLEILATCEDGTIMAIRHRRKPLTGIQFHPESFMTEGGLQLLKNWLSEVRRPQVPSQ